MRIRLLDLSLAVFLLGGAAACGEEAGAPTGSVCPPAGSDLTYENFGSGFMAAYCTDCHGAARVGADRQDAPVGLDFDTVAEIRAEADEIDAKAAAGPDATNEIMPPVPEAPTMAERMQLGEWLACGAP